jgi:hypothetical protein
MLRKRVELPDFYAYFYAALYRRFNVEGKFTIKTRKNFSLCLNASVVNKLLIDLPGIPAVQKVIHVLDRGIHFCIFDLFFNQVIIGWEHG